MAISEKVIVKRTEILETILSALLKEAEKAQKKSVEVMRSKTKVDNPGQSGHPDKMLDLEAQAGIYEQQSKDFQEKAAEIKLFLEKDLRINNRLQLGSIFTWKMSEPNRPEAVEETVIITKSGGGQISNFKLISEKAPLTKELIGKKTGEIVKFGEITAKIKRII